MSVTQISDFDATLHVYQAEVFVYYLTFCLFAWWAIYKRIKTGKHASTIYMLIMLWFLSQGYATQVGLHARSLVDTQKTYHDFLNTYMWHTRAIPRLVVAVLICWRQILKVYIEFFKPLKRRHSDKDGEDIQ